MTEEEGKLKVPPGADKTMQTRLRPTAEGKASMATEIMDAPPGLQEPTQRADNPLPPEPTAHVDDQPPPEESAPEQPDDDEGEVSLDEPFFTQEARPQANSKVGWIVAASIFLLIVAVVAVFFATGEEEQVVLEARQAEPPIPELVAPKPLPPDEVDNTTDTDAATLAASSSAAPAPKPAKVKAKKRTKKRAKKPRRKPKKKTTLPKTWRKVKTSPAGRSVYSTCTLVNMFDCCDTYAVQASKDVEDPGERQKIYDRVFDNCKAHAKQREASP